MVTAENNIVEEDSKTDAWKWWVFALVPILLLWVGLIATNYCAPLLQSFIHDCGLGSRFAEKLVECMFFYGWGFFVVGTIYGLAPIKKKLCTLIYIGVLAQLGLLLLFNALLFHWKGSNPAMFYTVCLLFSPVCSFFLRGIHKTK